jgi:hypothetical protein
VLVMVVGRGGEALQVKKDGDSRAGQADTAGRRSGGSRILIRSSCTIVMGAAAQGRCDLHITARRLNERRGESKRTPQPLRAPRPGPASRTQWVGWCHHGGRRGTPHGRSGGKRRRRRRRVAVAGTWCRSTLARVDTRLRTRGRASRQACVRARTVALAPAQTRTRRRREVEEVLVRGGRPLSPLLPLVK